MAVHNPGEPASAEESKFDEGPIPGEIVHAYLMERSSEYRELDAIRQKGWNDPKLDVVFEKRRLRADTANPVAQQYLYKMMVRNAEELHDATSGFKISRVGTKSDPQSIVDFCMAPGAFLNAALNANPGSQALALTLPVEKGGHEVRLPAKATVEIYYVDINHLAGDMGVVDVPEDHEEAHEFLPRRLMEGKRTFDLALCDGQVLRTHPRASYRERREAQRLGLVQLALGLEHLKEGGTMIVLLHKVDKWPNICLLHLFSTISTVQLFKPKKAHSIRSSFYMVASDVQVLHPEAIEAVKGWKEAWKAATFGSDEDFLKAIHNEVSEVTVRQLLDEFGDTFIELSTKIWKIQADALVAKDRRGWE